MNSDFERKLTGTVIAILLVIGVLAIQSMPRAWDTIRAWMGW